MSEELPLDNFPLRLAAFALYVVAAALLVFEPLWPLAPLSPLFLIAGIALHKFGKPLMAALAPNRGIAVVGEGGVRDPRTRRWIRFDQISQTRVRKDDYERTYLIELTDSQGRLLAALEQPDGEDDMAEKIESEVARACAARQAHQHVRSSTVDWLAALERSVQPEGYRSAALDLDEALRRLQDVHNLAEVRASAALALIASRDNRRLSQVRSTLNHNSPPLLIAMCDAAEPGLIDAYLVENARSYLTAEERSAITSFVSRRNSLQPRFRVASHEGAGPSAPDNGEAEAVTVDQHSSHAQSHS